MLLSSLPLPAQSDWTSFVRDGREQLDEAVRAIDAWRSSRDERVRERYVLIQDLYSTARRERGPVAEYALALEEAGVGEPAVPEEVAAARERIEDAFAAEVPVPGTRTFARARDWLSTLAVSEGFPVERFSSLVGSLQERVGSLPSSDAELMAESISVPGYTLADGVSMEDRAAEALSVWSLRVLAAADPERARLLESLVRTVSRLDANLDTTVTENLEDLAASRRELVELERASSISPQAYALASAMTFADPDRLEGLGSCVEELASLLEVFGAARLPVAVVVHQARPHAAFLVDTVDSLLTSASELQRYRFAERAGVSPAQLDRLHVALHRIRLKANAPTPTAEPSTAGSATSQAAFDDFLENGVAYVVAARPWAEGERSRSGDAYRWAMLPILSHPYAQYVLATVPELSATREMVDGFATSVYEGAVRRADVDSDALDPVVVGDAVAPFSRVYRTAEPAAAAEFYDAFAATAQDVEELSRDFAVSYTAGLTVAGYWSHTHGLHVAVVDEPEVPDLVRARVDDWFALARAADTVDEEIALTARGLIALRRGVLDELDPVVEASGIPSPAVLEPRLPAVIELLDDAATFTRDPLAVRDALALVFGLRPGSANADAATDALALALGAVVDRAREVEIPDRRLLERRARAEVDQ